LVHVRPLEYNPDKKKLRGFGNITVTIDVSPKKSETDVSPKKSETDVSPKKSKTDLYPFIDPELNREAYGNFFLNPRRRVEERLAIQPGGIIIPPILRGPEFLIIYHNTFKNAAEKLARWKNMRGLRTETVSIGTVGNTVSKIKTYIRNRRKFIFSRLRYVLLFGDVDMITPETVAGGPWGSNVTDYYYSTKTDPSGPTNYVLPWISIGRIPVRTSEEGLEAVNQIITYEKNPPCDCEYYRRMAFAAYFRIITLRMAGPIEHI